MCGICGAAGITGRSTLDDMATCLTHRGPDATGTHRDDHVALANTRLRVIDVEGGDQPVYNEDGDVVVVYNGEIYNFRELRSGLEAAGHRFSTDSDTEVLVHGYEEFGTDLFPRLNGMFAFALWDASAKRLFLVRDRAGIKPLYYAQTGSGLLFASEPKAILRSGLVEPAVDTDALEYFLALRYSPSKTTLFAGIDAVLPGTCLTLEPGDDGWTVDSSQFWERSAAIREPPADPVRAVRETLGRAVERQLVSDVPIGFYLSGGLDTSSVVAMASQRRSDPVHTFCMGFDDAGWDERPDARAVADHFDTAHHEIEIENEFVHDFPRMIWHADEPKRNLYPYYVAREMRKHVTVALGGLGADELFGGYVYRFDRLGRLDRLRSAMPVDTKATVKALGRELSMEQVQRGDLETDRYLERFDSLAHLDDDASLYVLLNSSDVIGDPEVFRERVYGPALHGAVDPADWIGDRWEPAVDTLRERALEWDFTVKLPNDFLLVEDRMSMAHSLESRVPFLDNELIDLAFSLPLSSKFDTQDGPTVGKAVLRRAMRPLLPDAVFEKDKQGFTMPTYPFIRDELLEHARAILDQPRIVRDGLISSEYLTDLLSREPSESLVPHYNLLWRITALEIWYQMYIVEGASGPRPIEHYYG